MSSVQNLSEKMPQPTQTDISLHLHRFSEPYWNFSVVILTESKVRSYWNLIPGLICKWHEVYNCGPDWKISVVHTENLCKQVLRSYQDHSHTNEMNKKILKDLENLGYFIEISSSPSYNYFSKQFERISIFFWFNLMTKVI